MKQKLFCNYFMDYGNATYSAKKAGYSARSARQIGARLIATGYIQNYIHNLYNRVSSNEILNAKDILKFLSNVVKGNVTEDIVEATPDGVYTGKKHPSISDRIDASKEIMKRYEPLYKARVAKLNNESKLKAFDVKTKTNIRNTTSSKVDELLDAIFKDDKN